MNKEAFHHYCMYGALQIYLLTYLLKSDVHDKNKYKRYIKN